MTQDSKRSQFTIRSQAFLLLATAVLLLSACRKKIHPGHYEGTLLKTVGSKYEIEPIEFEISFSKQDRAKVEVKKRNSDQVATVWISRLKKHQLLMKLEGLHAGEYLLEKVPHQDTSNRSRCYATPQVTQISLCYNSNQVYLKILDGTLKPILTISGSRFKVEADFDLEKPEEFSLDQAVREALAGNYDARISLEHVIQARSAATAAWLNLLPHLTANLIWHAPLPSYISIIATLQGLTPFLLPTWWLDGKISFIQTKIANDARIILQADLASNIEQLFYSYERDSRILASYQKVALLSLKHPQIQDWIQPLQTGLEQVLKRDQYAISLALGKRNPEAVAKISTGEENPSIDQCKPIEQAELAEIARRRSFELDQIDYLIQISKIREAELYFIWLDPSGDQRFGFGLNLMGQERVAQSQTKELKIKRDQIQSAIYRNAYLTSIEYNSALENSKKFRLRDEIEADFFRLARDLERDGATTRENTETLKASIQSYLAEVTQFETQIAAFRIARAKKDRLLLEGHFEDLLPQLPTLNAPVAPSPEKSVPKV